MEKIFVILWILLGIYILVLLMIFADLWSGLRKAKRIGETRTSYGYRRTISKMAQYYNLLIAGSIVDSIYGLLCWYLENYYQTSLWLFPFITFIIALVLCLIEIKSIREKAEDKVRLDRAGQVVQQIFINRENLEEVAKTISEYMSENSNKAESSEKSQTSNNEQQ
nr:MAG TPA: holin [Caudoviricetes sp.]